MNRLILAGAAVLLVIVTAAVLLAIEGGSGGADALQSTTPTVSTNIDNTISVVDNDYEPRVLQLPVGARVTWQFEGSLPHNVTANDGSFESDTMNSGSYQMNFDAAGTYDFHCTVHPGMEGRLIMVAAQESGTGATSRP